ncbi:dihydrolipoamide acetyltransferase family protein [Halobacillus sp. Marseille-P3879]|uniref:dihydrolipoamide acetyltransferase family protein n=1 Tax=Halobacillus sp. Marseille-P3879 TaxID=2045014 RepID=UPI000C7C485C|nr:dihydrolipoamide acetyltransferase family protein [Halobacillus sp. Marseille-P3879]
MAEKVVMPKFGMSMKEGTVAEWLKRENEPVKKGEPIATISSEKLTNELEAPASGIVLKITADVDETINVGTTLAYIGEEGEDVNEDSQQPSHENDEPSAKSEGAATVMTKTEPVADVDTRRIKISPAAKKLAKSNDVPIQELQATGPQGRITKQDVQDYIDRAPGVEEETQNEEPVVSEKTSNAVPAKGMRKVIAERMHQSLQESAQLTLMRKADITELLSIQKQAKTELQTSESDFSLTLTAFIVRATVLALQKHKAVNSAYINEEIHTFEQVHLGLATSLDEGLVVPVLFNADALSVLSLAERIYELSQKARDNQLSSDHLSGSTFTITNLGASGIEYFTPILNPPETGILGTGAYQKNLVLRDGEVRERIELPLSLTFDHRVLDGDPASSFLNEIIHYLEHPYQMLL